MVIMKTIKTNLSREEEILRIKREGQDRSRQLVKDGVRTQAKYVSDPSCSSEGIQDTL